MLPCLHATSLSIQHQILTERYMYCTQVAWARTEKRIVGFHSWHLLNRTAPNHAAPWDQELGLISMPAVVAELASIKKAIISDRSPPSPPLNTDAFTDTQHAKDSLQSRSPLKHDDGTVYACRVTKTLGQPVLLLSDASHNMRSMGNDYSFTLDSPLRQNNSDDAGLKSDDHNAFDHTAFRASGTPASVPAAADCALRALAGRFFAHHQPTAITAAHAAALHDALQLDVCGVARPVPDVQQLPGR